MRVRFFFAFAAALGAQPKLTIERLALAQYEDGPPLAADYQFVPGETAHFSCRIAGFQTTKAEETQTVKLAWKMRALDPTGVPLEPEKAGRLDETLTAQDKNWVPKIVQDFAVPPFAPTGTYHISVTVHDDIAETEAKADLTFQVRGHDVEPSDTLVLRNFKFVRAETDQMALRPAIYHPGDTLWAKFDITGYRFGENHEFAVDYGLAILNAAGTEVFSQPAAATESKQSFYPQRYVSGTLSLNLDANVAKAAYTLVIIVQDKIANQRQEVRQPFEVQ